MIAVNATTQSMDLDFSLPVAEKSDLGCAQSIVAESMFTTLVDEIDIWARRALAANGFGDY